MEHLNHDPCGEAGCIYYHPEAQDYCRVMEFVCPYSGLAFKKLGDIKSAMLAWNRAGVIDHTGEGEKFTIMISARPKDVKFLTEQLSKRLPLGMKIKFKTLPVWRCRIKKVQII